MSQYAIVFLFLFFACGCLSPAFGQDTLPANKDAAVRWLVDKGQVVEKENGTVTKLSVDLGDVSVAELTVFPALKILKWKISSYSDPKSVSGLKNLKQLKQLEIVGGDISPELMEQISAIPELTSLTFEFPEKLPTVKALSNCHKLETLAIKFAPDIDFATLRFLAKNRKLKEIHISDLSSIVAKDRTRGWLNDKHLESIAKISSLEVLSVTHGRQVSDEGLRKLASLPNLRSVSFKISSVTGVGLDAFPADQLQSVSLVRCDILPETFEAVGRMESLEALYLSRNSQNKFVFPTKAMAFSESLKHLFLGRTDFQSQGLASLRNLTSLQLMDCSGIKDCGIDQLPELSELDMTGCTIKKSELLMIASCKSLRSLEISRSLFRSVHLTPLTQMPTLEILALTNCKALTDDAAEIVARIPNLRTLQLHLGRLTDETLLHLAKTKRLRRLILGGSAWLRLEGFRHFSSEHPLQNLTLYGLNSTSLAGIEALAHLDHLQELKIQNGKISDAQIEALKDLKSLNVLKIEGSFEAFQHLRFREVLRLHPNLSKYPK